MNELHSTNSPYLLQHKDNPVWWKPWGSEAIDSAKKQNKIIFLSIGYATCHWCHVMEHESFENEKVAELLNSHFVSIKVDREEHPDVDQIYMDALHATGQRGGWPLSMFLTPDLKPIYGGTYFPRSHFLGLLTKLSDLWTHEPDKLKESAETLFVFLKEQSESFTKGDEISEDTHLNAFHQLQQNYDSVHGGFGSAPKFPPNTQIHWLLRFIQFFKEAHPSLCEQALKMAEQSFLKMSTGGLYDHVGGGYTRYSVDEEWKIPHFEKMLYVNAQSLENAAELYHLTKNAVYKNIALDITQYILRDMTSNGGGFYSAEDADSEGHEGLFYVWNYHELKQLIPTHEWKWVEQNFDISTTGNFEGKIHLHAKNLAPWTEHERWQRLRKNLLLNRDQRIRPLLDDKQLTSWNALMASALSKSSVLLNQSELGVAAEKCLRFIKQELWKNKKLHRRYRRNESAYDGTLDDYAYLIQALIITYECSANEEWLLWAKELQESQNHQFLSDDGAYHYTSATEKNLIIRTRDFGDNALPNSQSISAENLLRLSAYFLKPEWRKTAYDILSIGSTVAQNHPSAFNTFLSSDFIYKKGPQELVVSSVEQNIIRQVQSMHLPFTVKAYANLKSVIPLCQNKYQNNTVFYICQNGVCEKPRYDLQEALDALN